MNTQHNSHPLPLGYTARMATIEDHKLVFDLLNIHSQHLNGHVDLLDPEILRIDWLNEGFDPQRDVYLVFASDGTLVAFEECWTSQIPPVHPWIMGCVHPMHWDRGIGSHIVTWALNHARRALDLCPPELRVAPRSGAEAHNQAGVALFETLGWTHIRSYYRMVTELDEQPVVPDLPAGITIRPFNPETEMEAIYLTFVETFKDHYGFIPQPFEKGFAEFKHNFIEDPLYDPQYWFVAMDGDQMVGMCICRIEDVEDAESGWVNELGVRREWRKHGLGYAMLKQAFAAFYAAGKKRAGLGVDASSLTGALRLYERAGMRAARQFNQYETEFRPGRELAVTTVAEEKIEA